jgi:chloramphenicol-sensitive protein RarD
MYKVLALPGSKHLRMTIAWHRFAFLMNRYYLAALAAFVIWGFFALILKPMAIYPSSDILFYRVLMAALLMALGVLFSGDLLARNLGILKNLSASERKRSLLLTLSGGALLTANWYFFIFAMNHISIKAAAYAYLICPIITTVLAYFFLKEKLKLHQWLAVLLSVVSCGILAFGHWVDLFYSLVVAFSYAFYLITQRKNVHLERFFVLACQLIFSALLLIVLSVPMGVAWYASPSFFGNIFLIALGFTILPLWLNLYALKGLSSSVMGMLLYINPLLSFLVASLVFHEPASQLQLVAYAVIFLSVLIFNAGIYLIKPKAT